MTRFRILVKSDLKIEASVSPLIFTLGFPAIGVASRLLDARAANRDVSRAAMLADFEGDFGDVIIEGIAEGIAEGAMLGLGAGCTSRLRCRRGSPAGFEAGG